MVKEVVARHKGLQEVHEEFPWLVAFLEEAVSTDMHRNLSVKTKLDCLSEKQARRIGKNLAPALRQVRGGGGGGGCEERWNGGWFGARVLACF
jgi:hypothetical protein